MTRCGSCSRPSGSLTCERCADWLAVVLDPFTATDPRSIPWLYRHLGPHKVTGGDSDGRRPPGFRSTAPANTHQIALTDPRSKANGCAWQAADGRVHHEPAQGLLHAPTVLAGWLGQVCDDRGEVAPVGLSCDGLALALCDRLDDVTAAGWCPDMVDELRTVHGQLDSALAWLTGRHRPRSIGRCAVELPDGEPCGNPLYVPRAGDAVHCRQCGSYWPREVWASHVPGLVSA